MTLHWHSSKFDSWGEEKVWQHEKDQAASKNKREKQQRSRRKKSMA